MIETELTLVLRVGEPFDQGCVKNILLAPEHDFAGNWKLFDAIIHYNICKLRRTRPYIVASKRTNSIQELTSDNSLEFRHISNVENQQPLFYFGREDVSDEIPHCEDEFLILFREVPPKILPPWPNVITDLDSILVTCVDEFIKLCYADESFSESVLKLPVYE